MKGGKLLKGLFWIKLMLFVSLKIDAQDLQLVRCTSNLDTAFSRIDSYSTQLRRYSGFVTSVLTHDFNNPWIMHINQNKFILKQLKGHWILHVYTPNYAENQILFLYPYTVLSSPFFKTRNKILIPVNVSAEIIQFGDNFAYYFNRSIFLITDSNLISSKIFMLSGTNENIFMKDVRGTLTTGIIQLDDSTFFAVVGASRFINDLQYDPHEMFSWSIIKFSSVGQDSLPILCQNTFMFDTATYDFGRASFYHLAHTDSFWIASGMYDAYIKSALVFVSGPVGNCAWNETWELRDSIYEVIYSGQVAILNDSIAVVGFVLNDTIRFVWRELPAFAVFNYKTKKLISAYKLDYDTAERKYGIISHAYRVNDTLAMINISYPEGLIFVNSKGEITGTYTFRLEPVWGGPQVKRIAGLYPTFDDEQIRWIDFVSVKENEIFIATNYYYDTIYAINDPNYSKMYEEQSIFAFWKLRIEPLQNGYLSDSCCYLKKWSPIIDTLHMTVSLNPPLIPNQGANVRIVADTSISVERKLVGFLHKQECSVNFVIVSAPSLKSNDLDITFLQDKIIIENCSDCSYAQIIDIYGRIINTTVGSNSISLTNLPSGTYLLKIKRNGGELTYKFVVF